MIIEIITERNDVFDANQTSACFIIEQLATECPSTVVTLVKIVVFKLMIFEIVARCSPLICS